MSGRWGRRRGAASPLVFGCFVLACVAFALAWWEYRYVTKYEKMGGHPPYIYGRTMPLHVSRTVIGRVAEWGHPQYGRWGCVAVFATPGVVFLGAGVWFAWRRRVEVQT